MDRFALPLLNVFVPRDTPSERKVTVPVGVPDELEDTVAVNVTD